MPTERWQRQTQLHSLGLTTVKGALHPQVKVMVQRVQRAELLVHICFNFVLYEPTVRLALFTLSYQFAGF